MGMETMLSSPLALAVRAAGSQSAFGRLIGRRQSTVNHWLKHDRPLPAEHVLHVEQATGVPRSLLRPDLYPAAEYLEPGPSTVAYDKTTASNAYNFSDTPAGRTAAEAPAASADRCPNLTDGQSSFDRGAQA